MGPLGRKRKFNQTNYYSRIYLRFGISCSHSCYCCWHWDERVKSGEYYHLLLFVKSAARCVGANECKHFRCPSPRSHFHITCMCEWAREWVSVRALAWLCGLAFAKTRERIQWSWIQGNFSLWIFRLCLRACKLYKNLITNIHLDILTLREKVCCFLFSAVFSSRIFVFVFRVAHTHAQAHMHERVYLLAFCTRSLGPVLRACMCMPRVTHCAERLYWTEKTMRMR